MSDDCSPGPGSDGGVAARLAGGIDRRRALTLLGGAGIVAVGAACSSESSTASTASSTSSTTVGSTAAGGEGAGDPACTLTPQQTEGPFYLDLDNVRSDITEDREGSPLALAITVVDATSCEPMKDVAVDVWHCDAEGVYSGTEDGFGETFLRGTQITDRRGVAEFATIYPGWYPGRSVHIHLKVHTSTSAEHTGQLYFDDGLASEVYGQGAYADRGAPDTTNDADFLFAEGGSATLMTPTGDPSGYRAQVTVGVSSA